MGEVTDWVGHTSERLKQMKDHLERLKAQGVEATRICSAMIRAGVSIAPPAAYGTINVMGLAG
jgi:hypothetical protein